jgi:hypothetical protein
MIVARHPAPAGLPGTGPIKNPSRLVRHSQDGDGGRARSDPYPRLVVVLIVARLSDPITPSQRALFARIPGNPADAGCLATINRSRDKRAVIPVGHNPDTPCRTNIPTQPILEPRPAFPTTTLMPEQANWVRLLSQAGVQVLAWIGLLLLIRSVILLLQVSGK